MLSLVLGIPVMGEGKGQIRIEPHAFDPPDPITVTSPATFTITVEEHTAIDPQILLVVSEPCYDGGPAPPDPFITIFREWAPYHPETALTKDDFDWIDKGWVPPEPDGYGKLYQARSLRDHLGVPEDEGIWYAYVDMCVEEIKEGDSYEITVTVYSSSVRCLVYAFGVESKVPPTRPGFIIPEFTFGTVTALVSMISALFLIKRYRLSK